MRTLAAVFLLLVCGSNGRRVKEEQQIRKSVFEEQENLTEMSHVKSQSGIGIANPSRLKALGVLLMAHAAQGLSAGALHHPGVAMTYRPGAGQAHVLSTQSLVNNRGRTRLAVLMNDDTGNTSDIGGSPFPGSPELSTDNNIEAGKLLRELPQTEQQGPREFSKVFGVVDLRNAVPSPLGKKSYKKDIYEFASGQQLIMLERGVQSPENWVRLTQEFQALQAIDQAGINVVPHRLVAAKHPVTTELVWGLIEAKVSGEFVNIANDPEASSKLIAQVSSDPEAARNLKSDIDVIVESFNAGFQITDLQGIVQPDGHFVVIHPGEFGVGNILAGESIGQSKEVPADEKDALDLELQTTMMRLDAVQVDLENRK